MKPSSPLFVLAALGVLSSAHAAVDTSEWKCESCPFEKAGTSGAIDVGVGAVSDASATFGDFTGLQKHGAYLVADGSARWQRDNGWYGSASAAHLGLDSRTLAGEFGLEGLYSLRLRYAEIPRHLSEGASTPFLGVGSSVLTLPAGFPAVDTAAMPLATSLQSIDIGYKRSRFDAGLAYQIAPQWSTRVSLRRDVRDGTQRITGSFFSTASQLVAPIDEVTDQLEVSASFHGERLQATLAYQGSLFRNSVDALTWSNPFVPVTTGGDRGQLAPAPDNQHHQLSASAGFEIAPGVRASGEVALGRTTQNAAYLSATLNPNLAVPALPARSLDGRVDTFSAALRVTATPIERLRLHASYAREVRDNRTASRAYPLVSTDTFVNVATRNNPPFGFTQDRFKFNADYLGPGHIKASVGAEQNHIRRTLQEVVTTRDTALWGRVDLQWKDQAAFVVKLAHAERSHSTYGALAWVDPPENPLLRKFYLADRVRDSGGVRADFAVGERVNVGLSVDAAQDDYAHSPIGLVRGRSASGGIDVSAAISDQTQVHAFAQGERLRSRQTGSQVFAQPDWSGLVRDGVDVIGVGVKHTLHKGRLDLAADLAVARSRSDVSIDAGVSSPAFPTHRVALDTLKLSATYRVQDAWSLVGSLRYERGDATDWRLDGVLPATVPNLLAFGELPPRYHVGVLQLALRYRF